MNIKPKAQPPQKQQKKPKRISESYLHNAGLYYLQRFATSSANFREVMMRKVRKSCQHHTDQNLRTCEDMVDALVRKFQETGLLNDELYTRGAVTSLRRQGKSRKAIVQKMQIKGVDTDLTTEIISDHDTDQYGEESNPEHEAAMIFARKKRLGPFRTPSPELSQEEEKKIMEKSLSSMARAGFSYETCRHVLNLNSLEE
jgi:regulatory protein